MTSSTFEEITKKDPEKSLLVAKKKRDLHILMKFRHKIEQKIIDYLNNKSYRNN